MDANNPSAQPITTSRDDHISFDPSRMIGVIKRKALIKDLAAAHHAECLAYCRELLQFQRKWEEQFTERKTPQDTGKQMR